MVPALAALLTAVSAGAQNAQLDGLLVTASQFTPVDMMKYSQNNYSFTTGRVAAMGGAFTALGGDMASMGINPAGLGMYRNSVWGLSPAMTFTGNRNAYATAHDNNASRFSFNNIGTVLQLSQRSNGLVSFNLGLSYNKMEDFNYRGSVRLPGWRQNLRFAAAWERSMEGMYPGFTRPVLFSYRFYNQDLTTGSLLIEIGGHGNNLNEALYAGQLAANGLVQALLGPDT